ncbi:hypothetical protein [Oscillatoria salina]|uniref:hypothetical protein n=1 Tax=Oscillatoria salina TaxID=331517 RepID=UPI0013B66B5D|nr:hypothetical protein [Oscillatoria salina]MBZ8180802.1 hypothetical protein [Oscillatoria salina IIICB1]NET88835.1 hypothetical protein [Kamptonema sp. SIO1D9]
MSFELVLVMGRRLFSRVKTQRRKEKREGWLSWLGVGCFLTVLFWGGVSEGREFTEAEIESLIRQLPATREELNDSLQGRRLEDLIREKSPLFYYFLQLQQPQERNLQQESEAQIRELLERPTSLQQQILQQQIEEIERNRGNSSESLVFF